MDVLTSVLEGPRASEAFLLRSSLDPPWSLLIRDQAPLAVVAVVRGQAHVILDDGDVTRMVEGDVAAIKGPEPYIVADDPGTEPTVAIEPGNDCRTLRGEPLVERMGLGVRSWGNAAAGETVLLTGTYETLGEVSRRLMSAVPRLVLRRAGTGGVTGPALVDMLAAEVTLDRPGQGAVLDRLLDLLLIDTLRHHFTADPHAVPGWYRALDDPVAGAVLRLIHSAPDRDWTVAGLASRVGVSRALLARRFSEQVGEPPMTYLTRWRLALAADLLHDPESTVTSVAARVGYNSPFTFSAAFKRHFGASPSAYRRPAPGQGANAS